MAGSFSDLNEQRVLDYLFGNTVFVNPVTHFVALYTAVPGDANASGTEVSGGGYARVSVANTVTNWNAATGTNPTVKTNATTIAFATATAPWGTVVAMAIYDTLTGGNELCWAELLSDYHNYTVDPTTDVFTSATHGLTDGTAVRVRNVNGTVPGGLSAATQYFVIASTTNTFKLSLTSGGAAVDVTSAGDGCNFVARDFFKTIGTGDAISLAPAVVSIALD